MKSKYFLKAIGFLACGGVLLQASGCDTTGITSSVVSLAASLLLELLLGGLVT
jgi:hypothetical protein